MKIILKDPEYIKTCTGKGFINSFKDKSLTLCIADLSMLDFSPIDKVLVDRKIKNKELVKYILKSEGIEKVYELYNEYCASITVSDASAIILAEKLDNSIIINDNEIFSEICYKHKIVNYDFGWFFR